MADGDKCGETRSKFWGAASEITIVRPISHQFDPVNEWTAPTPFGVELLLLHLPVRRGLRRLDISVIPADGMTGCAENRCCDLPDFGGLSSIWHESRGDLGTIAARKVALTTDGHCTSG